jgi:hypothetical protein
VAFVRAPRRLDLDDVGAEVGQILRRRGPLQEVAEAHNPDSVKQHGRPSSAYEALDQENVFRNFLNLAPTRPLVNMAVARCVLPL